MFFFKPKKIVLDCFTNNASAYEYSKPDHARKFIPDWWKKLPNSSNTFPADKIGTMKGCFGFTEMYNRGFMLPLWSDLNIVKVNGQMHWQFADYNTVGTSHPAVQMGEYYDTEKYQHLKIHSPWFLKEKEGVLFHVSQAFWNVQPFGDYVITPGLVEFKYQSGTNINMFILKSISDLLIEFTTPMLHYVPLDDRRIELKYHLLTDSEFSLIVNAGSPNTFEFHYRKKKKLMQDREKSKCPFSF